jgi:protein-S-isoprenylcysteine O-methyltransferase Ste14
LSCIAEFIDSTATNLLSTRYQAEMVGRREPCSLIPPDNDRWSSSRSRSRSAPMDAALQAQFTIAALVCSVVALFFSVLAAFPGLKAVLAVVRDGILWFALFVVLGGVAFLVWQQLHLQPVTTAVKATQEAG